MKETTHENFRDKKNLFKILRQKGSIESFSHYSTMRRLMKIDAFTPLYNSTLRLIGRCTFAIDKVQRTDGAV